MGHIPNIDALNSDTHTLFLSKLILDVAIEGIDIWYMGIILYSFYYIDYITKTILNGPYELNGRIDPILIGVTLYFVFFPKPILYRLYMDHICLYLLLYLVARMDLFEYLDVKELILRFPMCPIQV